MTTAAVAWYAATISTIVFLWDIYKWWNAGAKLRVEVRPGMQSIGMPEYDGKTLIVINVSNYGDRPTTITGVGLMQYAGWIRRLRGAAPMPPC